MSEVTDKNSGVNLNRIIIDIVLSISVSILFVSSVFLSDLISIKHYPLEYVYIILVALLYGFLMVSRNIRHWGLKWVISIPISYLVLQYFWQTEFSIRALNWVLPEYGKRSAGGKFASSFLLCILVAACFISGIASIGVGKMLVDRELFDKFEKKQVIASVGIALIIAIAVLLLERNFPSAEYVKAWIYS